jgi:hypothetical protein
MGDTKGWRRKVFKWLRSTNFCGEGLRGRGTLFQSGVFVQAAAGAACTFVWEKIGREFARNTNPIKQI